MSLKTLFIYQIKRILTLKFQLDYNIYTNLTKVQAIFSSNFYGKIYILVNKFTYKENLT